MDDITLDRDDVSVEETFQECADCTGTITGDAHVVVIDFRSAGMTERLGPYCRGCANVIAQRIRDGLPTRRPA